MPPRKMTDGTIASSQSELVAKPMIVLSGLIWTIIRPGLFVNEMATIQIGGDGHWYVSLAITTSVAGPFRSVEAAAEGVQQHIQTNRPLFVPNYAGPTF